MARKKASETHDDLYQRLVDGIPDGIFQTDLDGNYTLVNPAYAEIHGYEPGEMLGISDGETWASIEAWSLVTREMKGRDLKNILKRFVRRDGSTGWLELSVKAKRDADGAPVAYEGVARDVTERKAIEAAEKEASERAEFLIDLMAHDLNNINQGMLLPLEIVALDVDLPPRDRKPVEMAIAQIQRSTELIRNVKKLQMVLQQPVALDVVDLYSNIVSAADSVRRVFPNKELELRTSLREGEFSVFADGFLPDLFFNLLHNSMKFDKKNVVVVDVAVKREDDGRVTVSFSDNGQGIPDEEKARVLMRRRGGKGSGIGLTLVKYLIERYNGSIVIRDRVADRHGEGVTISMTFKSG